MTTIYQQPHLPQKFAQNLLDCEIQFQLNDKLPSHILMRLIQLYRIGIEYFQSIRSYKYLYFQRKMNQIVKSQRIVNNLNDNREHIVIESLSDFKKQQIFINNQSTQSLSQHDQPNQKNRKKLSSNPFKRQIQQKISQHLKQQHQQKNTQLHKQYLKQQQLKKLQQLQQKQKQQLLNTQITQKTNLLSSNTEIKKILDKYDQQFQAYDKKINCNINKQEDEFKRKLQQRRARVNTNTDKRRMTKSFSEMVEKSNFITGNYQQKQVQNIQNLQLDVLIQVKSTKRNIPSTKMFSSFVQERPKQVKQPKEEDYSEYTYQQVQIPVSSIKLQ